MCTLQNGSGSLAEPILLYKWLKAFTSMTLTIARCIPFTHKICLFPLSRTFASTIMKCDSLSLIKTKDNDKDKILLDDKMILKTLSTSDTRDRLLTFEIFYCCSFPL